VKRKEAAIRCSSEKPSDYQIKNLLGSDSRLAGEIFNRVKRRILTNEDNQDQNSDSDNSIPISSCTSLGWNFSQIDRWFINNHFATRS